MYGLKEFELRTVLKHPIIHPVRCFPDLQWIITGWNVASGANEYMKPFYPGLEYSQKADYFPLAYHTLSLAYSVLSSHPCRDSFPCYRLLVCVWSEYLSQRCTSYTGPGTDPTGFCNTKFTTSYSGKGCLWSTRVSYMTVRTPRASSSLKCSGWG